MKRVHHSIKTRVFDGFQYGVFGPYHNIGFKSHRVMIGNPFRSWGAIVIWV